MNIKNRFQKSILINKTIMSATQSFKNGQYIETLEKIDKIFHQVDHHKEAAELKDKAIKRLVEQGKKFLQEKNAKAAQTCLRKVCELVPNHAEATALLQQATEKTKLSQSRERNQQQQFDEAISLKNQGYLDDAIELLQQFENPDQQISELLQEWEKQQVKVMEHFHRGRFFLNKGMIEQAEKQLQKAYSMHKASAQVQHLQEEIKRAKLEPIYEKAVSLWKSHHDIDGAMELVRDAESKGLGHMDDARMELQQEYLKFHKGNFIKCLQSSSIEYAQKEIDFIENEDKQLAKECRIELDKHKKEKQQERKKALENVQRQAKYFYDQKKYKEAIFHFEEILRLDPENTLAAKYIKASHEELAQQEKKLSEAHSAFQHGLLLTAKRFLEPIRTSHSEAQILWNNIENRAQQSAESLKKAKQMADRKKWQESLQAIENALELNKEDPKVIEQKLEIERRVKASELADLGMDANLRNEPQEAMRYLQESLDLVHDPVIEKELQRIKVAEGKRILSMAREHLQQGDFNHAENMVLEQSGFSITDDAVQTFLQELANTREDANKIYYQAEVEYKTGLYSQAAKNLQQLLKKYPQHPAGLQLFKATEKSIQDEAGFRIAKELAAKGEKQRALEILSGFDAQMSHIREAAQLQDELQKTIAITGKFKLMIYDSVEDYLVLPGREIAIGSDPDNDIHIGTLSRHHASIIRGQGHFFLLNSSTSHKTRVNGAQVKKVRLQANDLIEFQPGIQMRFSLFHPGDVKEETALLRIEQGQPEDLYFILPGDKILIGKSRNATIRIMSMNVEDEHAYIICRENSYEILPLSSVYIDGKKQNDKAVLRNGIMLKCGEVEIQCREV